MRMKASAIAITIATGAIAVAAQAPSATPPIRGFSAAAAAREHEVEQRLAALLSRDSTGRAFREFTAVPHPAGTANNKRIAEWIADRLHRYGWEDVRIHRYDVLLPFPEQVRVSMISPVKFTASLQEDAYAADPDTRADAGPTYLGMSASGDVTGALIYANSGNPADYDWLEAHGVSVKGKIAIVRYSNPYSYRGFKALTAEKRGIKALLIYSDPQEDGYRRGLTFPDGPFGPASHIQRGAITYDFMVAGDPLTPGWASIEGAKRIPESEAKSVPHIIAVPLSARDATPFLEHLTGPVAPPSWQGALPFTYRVGAGPSTLHVQVQMDGQTRAIYDVEARIRGSAEPEKLVLLGNHHDAWVYGGSDPSSGTATAMELARALGIMLTQGYRPRRTIVMNSWDAEEWHLTGSTEWGEQFAPELARSAVAYLNVDGSTSGGDFTVGAVGSMNPLIVETVRDVTDPATGKSVLDSWARREWSGTAAAHPDSLSLPVNSLGSGSDYTVFLNFLGLPVVDMAFDGPYGVYHSVYDDYYWMTHFGDPGFKYMTAMSEVWGRMALRLANAEVLPFDFRTYAQRVGGFVGALDSLPGVKEHLDLSPAKAAVARWAAASADLDGAVERALAAPSDTASTRRAAGMNERMRTVEQQWLLAGGIPGRPWFKHALYAPKYTYAALDLPGVREAIDAQDWTRARAELARLTERIDAVASVVQAAASP
jgi:N-acetylated-alpha-linked acidic dipeptidase